MTSVFDSLKERLKGWALAREVENFQRSLAAGEKMTTRELNKILVDAAQRKNYAFASSVIDAGASPDAFVTREGFAANIYTPLLVVAVREKDEKLLDLLLSKGADTSRTDGATSYTPLYTAVGKGNTPFVRKLLDAGAKLEPLALDIAHLKAYTDIEKMLKEEPARRKAAEAALEARQRAFQNVPRRSGSGIGIKE